MRPAPGQPRFTIPLVILTWLGCWLAANVLASVVIGVAGYSGTDSASLPMWLFTTTALILWGTFIIALAVVSDLKGTGRFRDDYALRFRPIDVLGVAIGVLSQLVVVNLVNWLLRMAFPDTFTDDRIQEKARDLYEGATGVWLIVLVVLLVFGAPLVEELVYRGFIQGSLSARVNDVVALVVTAAWFAIVHLRFVELPGLFAFALVLGACRYLTGRLGMSIFAHMAFNATAVALVAWS